MKNNTFKFFLAILGFVFGFSSNVAAQYGAPPSKFRIKGYVLSEKENTPLKNIKLNINKKGTTYKKSLTSNNTGEFTFNIYDYEIGDTLFITALDIDGDTNGSFQQKDTIINIKNKDLIKINDHYLDGENKAPFSIHLKSEAIKPKSQKKTDNK